MAKHGLVAVNHEKYVARGGIERERLAALIEQGMSITELAAELDRSKATVRHWLNRYGLQTLKTLGGLSAERLCSSPTRHRRDPRGGSR